MAKGDVVNDLQAITSGASLDFQPSAGVEVLIASVVHENAVTITLFDGSANIDGNLVAVSAASVETHVFLPTNIKMLVNNTNYLRLTEGSAATRDIGYTGVQTK